MSEVQARCPDLIRMRRVITRAPDSVGEDCTAVSVEDFLKMDREGQFALSWEAHGLHYGIPVDMDRHLADGRRVMFNGSRARMAEARARYPGLLILSIVASDAVLAARLAQRGREGAKDIEERLRRAKLGQREIESAIEINNNNDLEDAVNASLAAIQRLEEPVQ